MNTKTKMEKAIEKKEEIIRKRANTILNDSSHDWLRTPVVQRAIVLFYIVSAMLMTGLWLFASMVFGLLGTGLTLIALIALRSSVRLQADLPSYVLDERMIKERNASYVDAFRFVSATFYIGAAIALFVAIERERTHSYIHIGYTEANALFWFVGALVFGAPSIVLALRQSARR